MSHSAALRGAAIFGLLTVALGAFGAHGLKDVLNAHQSMAIWEKAVFYQGIHAVMLYLLAGRQPLQKGPWWLFALGILLFSGSLYLLAVSGMHWLGAITPFGGISFLAGWLWLVIAPRKSSETELVRGERGAFGSESGLGVVHGSTSQTRRFPSPRKEKLLARARTSA